jgi:hypothetical protein
MISFEAISKSFTFTSAFSLISLIPHANPPGIIDSTDFDSER